MKLIHPLKSEQSLLQEEATHVRNVRLAMKRLQMIFLSLESEGLRDKYRELLDLSAEQLDPPHGQLGVYLVGLDLDHVFQLLPIRLLIHDLSKILSNDANHIATRAAIASASLGMLQVGCCLLNCG